MMATLGDDRAGVASILLALRELNEPNPMSAEEEQLWTKRPTKKRRQGKTPSASIPTSTTVSLSLSRESVSDLLDDEPPRPSRLGLVSFPGETLASTAISDFKMPTAGKTEKPRFRPASSQSLVGRPQHRHYPRPCAAAA